MFGGPVGRSSGNDVVRLIRADDGSESTVYESGALRGAGPWTLDNRLRRGPATDDAHGNLTDAAGDVRSRLRIIKVARLPC